MIWFGSGIALLTGGVTLLNAGRESDTSALTVIGGLLAFAGVLCLSGGIGYRIGYYWG